MSDDDPMVFLQQQREKLAAMAEMAQVAQMQNAVAAKVQLRMQKINALLSDDAPLSSTSTTTTTTTTTASDFYASQHGGAASTYNSAVQTSSTAANMSGDEEVEYWKRKIAILSQPVTENGLAPPGTVPYPSTTSPTRQNLNYAPVDNGRRRTSQQQQQQYSSSSSSSSSSPYQSSSSISNFQASSPAPQQQSSYGHKVSEHPSVLARAAAGGSGNPSYRSSQSPSSRRGQQERFQSPTARPKKTHHGQPGTFYDNLLF